VRLYRVQVLLRLSRCSYVAALRSGCVLLIDPKQRLCKPFVHRAALASPFSRFLEVLRILFMLRPRVRNCKNLRFVDVRLPAHHDVLQVVGLVVVLVLRLEACLYMNLLSTTVLRVHAMI
jgi:hypothetical protein